MSSIVSYQPVPVRVGLRIQGRVIGALMMREIHTRFGRHNVGYLWLFIEPMMLSSAIAAVHFFMISHSASGMDIAPFYICGYTPFLMFRNIVNRATATIDSNRSLMFHRNVTITNLLLARGLLDAASTTVAMFVLLAGAAAVGLGNLPERPLLIMVGLLLMFWLCMSMSLIVCALGELSTVAERLIHPLTYIAMPFSGVFFIAEWIPEPYRSWLLYLPILHVLQLTRMGQFGDFNTPYCDIPYVIIWCVAMTFIGLFAIQAIRRHVVISD